MWTQSSLRGLPHKCCPHIHCSGPDNPSEVILLTPAGSDFMHRPPCYVDTLCPTLVLTSRLRREYPSPSGPMVRTSQPAWAPASQDELPLYRNSLLIHLGVATFLAPIFLLRWTPTFLSPWNVFWDELKRNGTERKRTRTKDIILCVVMFNLLLKGQFGVLG